MTQQQTSNEPMKPSERCNLEIDRWVEDGGDTRNKAQVIADATGCDEALELLIRLEWAGVSAGADACAICGQDVNEGGHFPDCRLAAYLKRYGGSTNE